MSDYEDHEEKLNKMTEPKVVKRLPPAFLQQKEQEAMKVTNTVVALICDLYLENRGASIACQKSVNSG
jgi:hypothetical protein